MSLAPTPDSPSESYTFGFPFCHRLWDLTKRQDDIAVAAMGVHLVADMEVDKVADRVADKKTQKKQVDVCTKANFCPIA